MKQLFNISLSFMFVVLALVPICWIIDCIDISDNVEYQEDYVEGAFSFKAE